MTLYYGQLIPMKIRIRKEILNLNRLEEIFFK